jgi:hypothetical protein
MRVLLTVLRDSRGRQKKAPPVEGELALATDKAYLFVEERLYCDLHRARVTQIGPEGLLIEGIEPRGAEDYRFQEWWCRPATGEAPT